MSNESEQELRAILDRNSIDSDERFILVDELIAWRDRAVQAARLEERERCAEAAAQWSMTARAKILALPDEEGHGKSQGQATGT